MSDVITEIDCTRVNGDDREVRREVIAKEAYLELIVHDEHVTNFLYSPGLEEQLVTGYLLSSGSITNQQEIEGLDIANNKAIAQLSKNKGSTVSIKDMSITVSHRQLLEIRTRLLENQRNHRASRGFHGALIWELSTGNSFVCEDIGRHNAVDKVIGYATLENYNLSQCMILLSGRLLSNIVSKCKNSGIPLIASMTVATDGGIRISKDSNMTIIGALSEDGFWLYNEGAIKVT